MFNVGDFVMYNGSVEALRGQYAYIVGVMDFRGERRYRLSFDEGVADRVRPESMTLWFAHDGTVVGKHIRRAYYSATRSKVIRPITV